MFKSLSVVLRIILTVRPSDNILQKSILRGHKSPPTPRHAASSLSALQVNLYSSICRASPSWYLSGSETLVRMSRREELFVWSAHQPPPQPGAMRWRLFTHLIIQETKTTPGRRRGRGSAPPHESLTGPGAPSAGRLNMWTHSKVTVLNFYTGYFID